MNTADIKRKGRDYKNLMIFQSLLIVLGLILSPLVTVFDLGKLRPLLYILFLVSGGAYILFLWTMLRNFTKIEWLEKVTLYLLVSTIIVSFLLENPLVKLIKEDDRAPYLLFVHISLLLVELLLILYSMRDIFSGNTLSASRLWGSASLYLMIALAFASLYDVVVIFNPNSFGVKLKPGFPSYSESIYYSINSLVKWNDTFPDAIKLVKNIRLMQAVLGELFIALLVGNLLNRPVEEQKKAV